MSINRVLIQHQFVRLSSWSKEQMVHVQIRMCCGSWSTSQHRSRDVDFVTLQNFNRKLTSSIMTSSPQKSTWFTNRKWHRRIISYNTNQLQSVDFSSPCPDPPPAPPDCFTSLGSSPQVRLWARWALGQSQRLLLHVLLSSQRARRWQWQGRGFDSHVKIINKKILYCPLKAESSHCSDLQKQF